MPDDIAPAPHEPPTIQHFLPTRLGPKPWGEELLVAHTQHYTGKVLTMRAGTSGPLQYHRTKDETFHLWQGKARVYFASSDGRLFSVVMESGESYHVPPGAVHRVEAITKCVFFEASTPVFDDRVAVTAAAYTQIP